MKIIKNTGNLRIEINKAKSPVIVLGGDNKVNRAALENKKVDILLSPEKNDREDSFHYRKSGLNQVLCKLAKQNNVAIGFDFSNLINTLGRERARILGRMFFNYKLCRKYKVKMVFSSFSNNKFEQRNDDCMRVFERILAKYSKNL